MELIAGHACFGGTQRFHSHESAAIGLPMRFGVYTPPAPSGAALVCLAGLTCTEETFAIKAGAQRVAAALGLTLLMPDTSPRATGIAGEADEWDFGAGAGFFAAPMWPVADQAAYHFATTFYTELFAGATVAEATRQGRRAAYVEGDPSWLAYSVYAHPHAMLAPGS